MQNLHRAYLPPPHPPPETNPRVDGLGYLSILSDELISEDILSLFSAHELCQMALVSRMLYVLSRDDQLWKSLALREFGSNTDTGGLVYNSTWLITYGQHHSKRLGKRLKDMSTRIASISLAGTFSSYIDSKWRRCYADVRIIGMHDSCQNIQSVFYNAITPELFQIGFEAHSIPMMLVESQDGFRSLDWPAFSEWSIPQLVEKYGDTFFKVGNEYGYPKNVWMSFRAYVDYMFTNHDESPLYIFDSNFGEADKAPEMLNHFAVPPVFEEDLLGLDELGLRDKRPAYRWLVIGPARSGASWHVDPYHTSAWNTLVVGQKRWALYPPHVQPPGLHLSSLQWFLEVYPNLHPSIRPMEVVQYPGQTIVVPGGWWHMVLNIDDVNIAVTQNWMSTATAKDVLTSIKMENPELFQKFETGVSQLPLQAQSCLRQAIDTANSRILRQKTTEDTSLFKEKALSVLQATFPKLLSLASSESGRREKRNLHFCGHANENIVFYHSSTKTFLKFYVDQRTSTSHTREYKALQMINMWFESRLEKKLMDVAEAWFPKLMSQSHDIEIETDGVPFLVTESCGENLVSLAEVLPNCSNQVKEELIAAMVSRLRLLHQELIFDGTGREFHQFIQNRLDTYSSLDYIKTYFPHQLVSTVQDYICSWSSVEASQFTCRGIIHGDLIPTNILGRVETPMTENGQLSWHFSHLIDFGDSFPGGGDPLWDLVCFYGTCLFDPEHPRFHRLCESYRYDWNRQTRKRAMVYVLLWPYSNLVREISRRIFSNPTYWSVVWTMEKLEEIVFGEVSV